MARHIRPFRIDETVPFQRFIARPEALGALNRGLEAKPPPHLTAHHPTLVYRFPSRNDDARTLIATALPSEGFLDSTGYVHGIDCHDAPAVSVLALLAFLSSYICDWWVRRFVDRHVTAGVVNGLRLPEWGKDRIQLAAEYASALLARNGVDRLPGGYKVTDVHHSMDTEEILVRIEHLVAAGFDLDRKKLKIVLNHFKDKGCPPELREALLSE